MLSGRRWIGLLGAASLFAAASCDSGSPATSTDAPEPAPVQGSVTGSVQIESTGVEGLQISLAGPVTRTSATDAGGRFRFDGLDEGSYVVTVSGLPSDAAFEASDSTVSISRDRPAATVDFAGTWKRDASIEVTVRVDGVGFEAATVTLQGPDTSFDTPIGTTDGAGTVIFEGLRRATWGVTLTGYDPLLHDFPSPTVSVAATDANRRTVAFDGTEIPQIPTSPVGLVATSAGSDTIGLEWTDASDDEERFEIERRASDGTWGLLDTVAAGDTSFHDTGLAPATTWAYRVRACNVAGCSSPSNEAEATTDEVPPAPPADLTVSATGPTTADVAWTDASDNETRFELERRTAASGGGSTPAGPWSTVATPAEDAGTFSDTGLDPATTYEYRIRACNGAGCSDFSATAVMTTDDVPPSSPTDPAVVVTGATTLRVTWTDTSDNEDHFDVERRPGGAGAWSAVGSAAADVTRFDDSGLVATTAYGYRVR
ncbi:MAG TPA: fibronectin type III domain-containing protein, partial [Longimicrobiales bacterium]|nr:fibronectin type III domain-containing protein [Longimicrobiales bacterium]